MKLQHTMIAMAALALQAACARAQVPSAPVPQVTINGAQSDIDAGRDFVAGKIIIGRRKIEASGARTVEELLKREPAVTVSADGRIGLLNMPGYTQILIDGQAPLAGQSPAKLDLVHIEKIEIVKSSMAEYGPFGIAGTINMITRKIARRTATSLSGGLTATGGRAGGDVALSHNQSTPGSALRFTGSLSASEENAPRESYLRQVRVQPHGGEQDEWRAHITGGSTSRTLIGSSDFTWQKAAGETLSVSPQMFFMRGPAQQAEARRFESGAALDILQDTRSALTMMSLPFKWTIKPSAKSQLEVNARASGSRLESRIARSDMPSGTEREMRNSISRADSLATNFGLSYRTKLDGGHALKAGASVLRVREELSYDSRIGEVPDTTLNSLGTLLHATTTQLRGHLQDEWRIDDGLAVSAGLAGAGDIYKLDEQLYRGRKSFRVWSPSFHVSKKIGGDDKRQLRLSLARSFKAPSRDEFTSRPTINPLAPCPAAGLCGPNSIDTADRAGNLDLRPERSLGLNLSYAHGFGDDSQVTLEFFTRRIDGKIGSGITLDNVVWSTAPRYVARPVNLGDAVSTGLSLETELALGDVWKMAPAITLRGNLGFATSRVSGLPGPDNRLDKQTPWNAKLGGTYTMKAVPVKLDLDANWTPSVWVRTGPLERISIGRRTSVDASATWSMSKESRLVINAVARLPRTRQEVDEYAAGSELIRLFTNSRKFSVVSVRFETKL